MQLAELARRLVERLEHGADVRLQVTRMEHLLEGAERALVRRLRGQDLAIDLDGALAVAELGLEGLAEAELQRSHLTIALGELDLALQGLGQLGYF